MKNVHLKRRNGVFGFRVVLGNQGHMAAANLFPTCNLSHQEGRVGVIGFHRHSLEVLCMERRDPVPCRWMAPVPTPLAGRGRRANHAWSLAEELETQLKRTS